MCAEVTLSFLFQTPTIWVSTDLCVGVHITSPEEPEQERETRRAESASKVYGPKNDKNITIFHDQKSLAFFYSQRNFYGLSTNCKDNFLAIMSNLYESGVLNEAQKCDISHSRVCKHSKCCETFDHVSQVMMFSPGSHFK